MRTSYLVVSPRRRPTMFIILMSIRKKSDSMATLCNKPATRRPMLPFAASSSATSWCTVPSLPSRSWRSIQPSSYTYAMSRATTVPSFSEKTFTGNATYTGGLIPMLAARSVSASSSRASMVFPQSKARFVSIVDALGARIATVLGSWAPFCQWSVPWSIVSIRHRSAFAHSSEPSMGTLGTKQLLVPQYCLLP